MNLEQLLEELRKRYPHLFQMNDSGEMPARGLLNQLLGRGLDVDLNNTLYSNQQGGGQRLYEQNKQINPGGEWMQDPNMVGIPRRM